jgi:hypothetical protein
MSYSKLLLWTWCSFAVILFLQSWSLAASVVPALLPTLVRCGVHAGSKRVSLTYVRPVQEETRDPNPVQSP